MYIILGHAAGRGGGGGGGGAAAVATSLAGLGAAWLATGLLAVGIWTCSKDERILDTDSKGRSNAGTWLLEGGRAAGGAGVWCAAWPGDVTVVVTTRGT